MKVKKYSSADFYDRQWEQQQLHTLIQGGQNVLVTAPRRVGKTQLTFKLLDWATSEGWLAAFADVQHAINEADFLDEVCRALTEAGIRPKALDQLKNTTKALRKILSPTVTFSDGESSVEIKLSPEIEEVLQQAQDGMNQLFETISTTKGNILIGLDELPIFLTTLSTQPGGKARVTAFLHWFRRLRGLPNLRSLRWLLSGSIGLDTFVEARGLAGTINDLRPQKLGPFEPEIALAFVQHYASQEPQPLKIDEITAKAIVESVGWPLPYYLRLLVDEMKALPPPKRSLNYPALDDVATAYAELISPDKKVQFAHWHSRLELQFGKVDAPLAHLILEQCCKKPLGCLRSTLRSAILRKYPQHSSETLEGKIVSLLSVLERDGYLHTVENRWAFRSFLLRDFWLKHVIY